MFLAVFCLFSVIGFFSDLMNLGRESYAVTLFTAVFAGIFAVLYAICATRFPNYYMVLLSIVQAIFWAVFGTTISFFIHFFHLQPVSTETGVRFAAESILAVTMLSYAFFLNFIRTEGQEAFRIKNELALAHGIQKTLVPPITLRTAGFELYGRSDPSDKVGGDLVDALSLADGSVIAYLADIAGHGLQAGILMGMVKTAARTALLDAPAVEPGQILPLLMDRLNRVLPAVKEPQMYATFAGFRLNPDGGVYYALAAHPPVLHFRMPTETACASISTEQFPIGLLPVSGFFSESMIMHHGDLLIAFTDGILEASNSSDEEFGLDRLQSIIAAHREADLPQMADAILSAARAFGRQIDDQTLLLIRRL